MNKKHLHISDHLLAKFLDGKTDAAETEQVLAYLNENNENLEDFMNIRSAIQIEDEYPARIDLSECLNVVNKHIASSNKKNPRNRFYLIASLVAAAIMVGVVCLIFFNSVNKDYNPVAHQENYKDNKHISQDEIAEETFSSNVNNKELANNETQESKSNTTSKSIDKEEETEIQAQTKHRNTAEKSEKNLFEMLKPAKTPYVVLCKNLERAFDFQWNTNAETIEVVLKDKNGKTILNQEVTQNVFHIKYADYIKYEDIHWELKATFENGEIEVKRGILKLITE
jgi:hypothetical protein